MGASGDIGVALGNAAASAMAGNASGNAGNSGAPKMALIALTWSVCVSVKASCLSCNLFINLSCCLSNSALMGGVTSSWKRCLPIFSSMMLFLRISILKKFIDQRFRILHALHLRKCHSIL